MFTQEFLQECFSYDPVSGICVWLDRPRSHFASDAAYNRWQRFIGKEAFTSKIGAYNSGSINNTPIYKHRAVWIWMTGEQPNIIDHINGIGSDNTWVNLRNVTTQVNLKNSKKHIDGKNPSIGVDVVGNKYRARICIKSKQRTIGIYDNLSDAISARKNAEKRHGFHRNHGRVT